MGHAGIVGTVRLSPLFTAEEAWFTRIAVRCGAAVCARLLGLVAVDGDHEDGDEGPDGETAEPGRLSRNWELRCKYQGWRRNPL